MPRRVRYANNSECQDTTHDEIVLRMHRLLPDELDSSSTSLHLDAGQPVFRAHNGILKLYHGNRFERDIKKLSDVTNVDLVTNIHGQIMLSSTVTTLYKALSDAVDRKIFVLKGRFDCANAFLKHRVRSSEGVRPIVKADICLPYYFRDESPIRGDVKFSEVRPAGVVEENRRIIVINVKRRGYLRHFVPHGTVVYLGGDHNPDDQFSAESKKLLQKRESVTIFRRDPKYGDYREFFPAYGPCDKSLYASGWLYMSHPFPNTWIGRIVHYEYNNVGFTKFRNGQIMCWVTENDESQSSHRISFLPLSRILYCEFRMPAEYKYECFSINDYNTESLESMLEGAWIMRGGFIERYGNHLNNGNTAIISRIRKEKRAIK